MPIFRGEHPSSSRCPFENPRPVLVHAVPPVGSHGGSSPWMKNLVGPGVGWGRSRGFGNDWNLQEGGPGP